MNLKKCRLDAGLTQIDVAEKLGVTQGTVSGWECLGNLPIADKLPAIAELYHCTIDDLFHYTKKEVS